MQTEGCEDTRGLQKIYVDELVSQGCDIEDFFQKVGMPDRVDPETVQRCLKVGDEMPGQMKVALVMKGVGYSAESIRETLDAIKDINYRTFREIGRDLRYGREFLPFIQAMRSGDGPALAAINQIRIGEGLPPKRELFRMAQRGGVTYVQWAEKDRHIDVYYHGSEFWGKYPLVESVFAPPVKAEDIHPGDQVLALRTVVMGTSFWPPSNLRRGKTVPRVFTFVEFTDRDPVCGFFVDSNGKRQAWDIGEVVKVPAGEKE